FISFDNGATWQPFQLNLPATVISDMKVYRKDLVVATQGRGFWIVDNLTPLHQITDAVAAARAHLFTPRTAYRGSREPAHIDYFLNGPVQGTVTLEIVDGAGTIMRSFTSDTAAARPSAAARPGMPGSQGARFGEAAGAPSLPVATGLNRFEWDLRVSGAGTAGRGAGPMEAPGHYTARLLVPGARPLTAPVVVAVDPRLLADGIGVEDLQAQFELAARVAQLMSDVQQLQSDIRAARDSLAGNTGALARLDALEQRVVTRSGQAYPQPMLAAQISYLNGIVSRGDNRPHRDAYVRHDELRAQVDAARTELQQIQ
ncbi:MAG: hypothetical protein ACRELT_05465, partial [Longimicrobiales bacterium]